MRAICFHFQVHFSKRVQRFRFFDIGTNHQYFDEDYNIENFQHYAQESYLKTNQLLLELIEKYKNKFKVSFSISGTTLEMLETYTPEVLDSFIKLSKTGSVEFVAETYAYSLTSLLNEEEFEKQVLKHRQKIRAIFGQTPKIFKNTEMIYNNKVGQKIADLGFMGILTEENRELLEWRSPNYIYTHPQNLDFRILMRNFDLSDDIAFKFHNPSWEAYPLTSEKFSTWLSEIPKNQQVLNIFMGYDTFGVRNEASTGIFDFLRYLPHFVFQNTDFQFLTPSETIQNIEPIATLSVEETISWAGKEKNASIWLGNELQQDVLETLYKYVQQVEKCTMKSIHQDWNYLQDANYLTYLCMNPENVPNVSEELTHLHPPYNAYINLMNIMADFKIRVQKNQQNMQYLNLNLFEQKPSEVYNL